ncbi:hypothetical protein GGR88_001554 [Sphingomonas jejuensis]|uniref:Phasin protein n=2 Tax=Sphingomonas jejuensis TaxID=904715 RepID=A0ABX0XLH8_9SPHN|nr:hypothetical protein [Sphingomonas jejuensis]
MVLAQVAPAPVIEPTALDGHLDGSWRALNQAGSHICNDAGLRQAHAPLWARFQAVMDRAEDVLGRRPETEIYTNSYVRRANRRVFDRAINDAKRHLQAAERLMGEGEGN